MLVWYHNPSDKDSVEALQKLFISGERMPVINTESGKARMVLTSEDRADEWAEMGDPKEVTPQAARWMRSQDAQVRKGNPVDFTDKNAPAGLKKGRGKGAGHRGGGGS